MQSRNMFNRLVILFFMGLIGWSFARGIYFHNWLSIFLSGISLIAGIYFLYLAARSGEEASS